MGSSSMGVWVRWCYNTVQEGQDCWLLRRDTCAMSLHGTSFIGAGRLNFPHPPSPIHWYASLREVPNSYQTQDSKNPINQPLGFCITSINNWWVSSQPHVQSSPSSLHESSKKLQSPRELPQIPLLHPEKILTNTATVPILEQFLTNLNHIIFLIFIHPFPPILVWLPWFLHRWSRLHRRSLHLWRFWALRSSCSGRRRCRSHQRLGRWKTERAVISPTQTPNNAGLKGNSLQQYHTCNMGNLMTPGRCQKLFFQESYWRVES